ncbi:hypothetical protein GCM10009574_021240 [Streptomyces asiaticus]|uniref:Uncharacterized protein n=1 Tax=Streptomyces rhizosphaericus TaxID=114699 RepID=A0ABN1SPY9_9ACTN
MPLRDKRHPLRRLEQTGNDAPSYCRISAARPSCPTYSGKALQQAVVFVAGQTLTGAETLDLSSATPEELTYHLGAVRRSLRSLLQLLAPVAGEEDR